MNKLRKCAHCKDRKPVDKGIITPISFFCSHDHAIEYAKAKQDKARERQSKKANADRVKAQKLDRAQNRKRKEALKTAGDYIKEAQASVNRYIRERDRFDGCISCGKSRQDVESSQGWMVGGCWDAGHFRSRGAAGHLRFNTYNNNKQCKSCNGGSGKFAKKAVTVAEKYRNKLIKKIGLEKVERLECDNQPRKFTIDYLKRVKTIFNKRYRMQKKRWSATF